MGLFEKIFGGGEQQSVTRPLDKDTVAEYFQKAARSADQWGPTGAPEMPEFQWDTLTGGDYNRLEDALYQGSSNRIINEREIARAKFRDNLRKLGIADEPAGMALETENITDPYGRQLADAASQATAARYDLQQTEQSQMNPARMEYGWKSYDAPRDFWLNKMKTWYQGMGSASTGASSQTPGMLSGITEAVKAFKM